MHFFISGIGTEVGKTVVSALMVRALAAAYWKPLQAGNLSWLDRQEVGRLVGTSPFTSFRERFVFPDPLSPHLAARRQGLEVRVEDFFLPAVQGNLVIEGAGGVLVPLNARETMLDLIAHLACPVVLVSKCYLGSINHTLLTWEVLRARAIPIAGLVFNGERTPGLEELILEKTQLPLLLALPANLDLTPAVMAHYATLLRESLRLHGLCTLG